MKSRISVQRMAVAAAFLAIYFAIAVISGVSLLIVTAPVLLAAALLFFLYQSYFLLRTHRWHRRQQEEKEALARLAIPPDVQKPEAFEGVRAIDDAQKNALAYAPDYQGRFRGVAITVALAPPLALLFLSVQTLFFPYGGPWGAGFVFAEALFLLWIIWKVWATRNPAQQWLHARIHAELLRREQYLCLASVGPYLNAESGLADQVAKRLSFFVAKDVEELRRLIPLASPRDPNDPRQGDRLWRDELSQSASNTIPLPDAEERMSCYLHYRIRKQKMWFTLGLQMNQILEELITRVLKTLVLCAFFAAAIHATLLLAEVKHYDLFPQLIHLFAFVLPPLGASFLALMGLLSARALALSYQVAKRELCQMEVNLSWLIRQYKTAIDDGERRHGENEFQALVLDTEHALKQEMQRWILINDLSEYEVAV